MQSGIFYMITLGLMVNIGIRLKNSYFIRLSIV